MLPIPGVEYLIKHVSSGYYIHPQGGENNPKNNTYLVLHPGHNSGSRAIHFLFENNQLKHCTSGKYVHPYNGVAKNEADLVLYDGKFDDRTRINMVNIHDKTFLKSGNTGHFVHQKGGEQKPKPETHLTFSSGTRNNVSFEIEPAEICKIIRIDYDKTSLTDLENKTVAIETNFTNETDAEQEMLVSIKYTKSLQNTFTFSFEESLSFSAKTSIGTDVMIAKTETTIGVEIGFKANQTVTKTETNGVEVSHSSKIKVLPRTTIKYSSTTKQKSGNVPFTMYFQTSNKTEFSKKGNMKVEYFFDQHTVVKKID